jgi:hypothetical protein
MEDLIALTEAISWDDPSSQLETIPADTIFQDSLPLLVHIISQKTHNNQAVYAALSKAWDFAIPFSFVALGPNKYLLKFSKKEHIDKINQQVTWNVNGCLLTLQQWSPTATLGEIASQKFPFWIQIHGLPLENMTTRNAIAIGKGLGDFLKVDDAADHPTPKFRSYLRVLADIDVHAPLKPGFQFRRDNGDHVWISLKYERLDIYCTSCGCIGHKKDSCRAPQAACTPGKYAISLLVNIFSNLPPTDAGVKSSFMSSSLSQPSSAQFRLKEVVQSPESTTGTTNPPNRDVTINHLTTTILPPLKQLSLQPNTPPLLTKISTDISTKPLTSLNEDSAFPPTAPHRSDSAVLLETTKQSAPHSHHFPKASSSSNSNPHNLNTGSISIILNQNQPGPSATPQAQSIPTHTSPAHIQTVLTASSSNPTSNFSNFSNLPAKKHSTKHIPHTKKQLKKKPIKPHPPEPLSPKQNFSLIKKRNRVNHDQTPHKKGSGTSLQISLHTDDMDTYPSPLQNTPPLNLNPCFNYPPRHFFKAVRSGKNALAQKHATESQQNTGDIHLSPKTS